MADFTSIANDRKQQQLEQESKRQFIKTSGDLNHQSTNSQSSFQNYSSSLGVSRQNDYMKQIEFTKAIKSYRTKQIQKSRSIIRSIIAVIAFLFLVLQFLHSAMLHKNLYEYQKVGITSIRIFFIVISILGSFLIWLDFRQKAKEMFVTRVILSSR